MTPLAAVPRSACPPGRPCRQRHKACAAALASAALLLGMWLPGGQAGAAAPGSVADRAPAPVAASSSHARADPLAASLGAILADSGVPGAGIAIVRRGQAPRILSLGLADVASRRPVDADTLFRTASVGKIFTTLAVMRLVEDGKLTLDTPLRAVAPEVTFRNPWDSTAPVRIVHLLEHTTGWDDLHLAEYAYDNRDEVPLAQTLAFHPGSRVSRWVPGSRMSYSNSGPPVAAYVVQKIGGQPFEEFVARHIFQPLGMNSATYFADAAYQRHGAKLYTADGRIQPYLHILYRPAGSTNVTAADMGKLMAMFLDRGMVGERQLFAPRTTERMEGRPTSLSGPGMLAMGYRGVRFSGHSGVIDGAMSEFWYQPELGIGYVAMINSKNGTPLEKIQQLILDELMGDATVARAAAPAGKLDPLWRGVDGIYINVAPRMELARLMLPMTSIRLAYTPDGLARSSPLHKGSDMLLPGPDGSVIEPWTGLPVVRRQTDPLAGDVVRIGDTVYARVSAFRIYGFAAVGGALLLTSAASLLFALIWIPRRLLGRIPAGPAVWIRAWPLAATLLLGIVIFAAPLARPQESELGVVSPLTVTIMLASAVYGIAALAGLVSALRWRRAAIHRGAWRFAGLHALLHTAAALYLGWYGVIGIRLWA